MSFPALLSRAFALLILLATTAVPATAQHEEVQSLASRLAGEISKGGRKRVAVANFAGPEEGFTQLGTILSLEFAASLAWSGSGLDVMHSPALAGALREVGSAPKNTDIFDDRVVKRLGQLSGAEVIVTGMLGVAGDHVEFSVRAANAATSATLAQATGNLPLTPVVKELLAIRLLAPVTSSPLGPAGTAMPRQPDFHDGAYESGRNCVTYPKCIACPNPSYTEEARKAKYSGTVLLRLIVGEGGRASNITIVQGLGMGLDEAAIRAVKGWRFQPATDASGKPVPVWTTIEVTFRTL